MSEQKTNVGIGRDQYNISGDKTKLKVDNRVKSGSSRKLIVEVVIGILVAVAAGYILFRFGWN